MALQNGCSTKAVSDMLGHYSSSFTMDVYAAVSETMKQDTRERMEQYIQRVSGS
jgi:integrase